MRFRLKVLSLYCLLMSSAFANLEVVASPPITQGWMSKTLWYVPNRVMDLLDVFRVRVKVGPGLAAGARFTDAFSFYGGSLDTVYVGLPGPRENPVIPPLLGREQAKGIVLVGVDATDIMTYPPGYDYSEIGLSAHILLVGADVGFSLAEFSDFFLGWFGRDWKQDDFPRSGNIESPSRGSVLNHIPVDPYFPMQLKPIVFPSFSSRLDYLQRNVPLRLQGHMQSLDLNLSDPSEKFHLQPPVTDFRLSIFYEMISGPNGSMTVDPNLKLKVDLPNLEKKFSLFLQSSYDDDLPGISQSQRDDKGWSVGARRQLKQWNFSTEIGIHTKWEPELFLRLTWSPYWNWNEWFFGFKQRGFWENEDGFGSLTELNGYHWAGNRQKWIFRTQTAGKFSESTVGFEWQQTFVLGHLTSLRDEKKRLENISIGDCLNGYGFKTSVFGRDRDTWVYKSTVVFRRSLYKDFAVLEIEPGLEWRDENTWTTQYRIDAGVILFF